jgi:hypothetical protein
MLGLSKQRVFQLFTAGDWPAPVGSVGGSNVWRTRDIALWALRNGRHVIAPRLDPPKTAIGELIDIPDDAPLPWENDDK